MSNKEKATKISWLTLAFMAFSTVWGFGNITNGFVYFNGPQVIFSWIFMFALYFIPYALMAVSYTHLLGLSAIKMPFSGSSRLRSCACVSRA